MKKAFLIISLALSHFIADAQVKIWIEATKAIAGDTMTAKIMTSGFEGMGAFQFSLHWDTCALQFVSLHSLNNDLRLTPEGNFNTDTAYTNKGQLIALWYDNSGLGQTLPDSSVLFGLDFLVVGEPGKMFTIGFSDEPTPILFGDVTGQIASDAMGVKGTVTKTFEVPFVRNFNVFPNPVTDQFMIELELTEPLEVNMEMLNGTGSVIARTRFDKMQNIKLQFAVDQLPSGMYFIRLKSRNGSVVRKIMKVGR